MLSEWRFRYETRDLFIGAERKFSGETQEPTDVGGRMAPPFKFSARIVPEDDEPPAGVEQIGSVYVTVPFPPNEGRDLARFLAHTLSERVSYSSGDFRLNTALIWCKRIGENEAEVEEIGEQEYSMEMSLVEVVAAPDFDSGAFARTSRAPLPLLSLFNETMRDASPVRRFLGFFRILESLSFAKNDKRPLKAALGSNDLARRHFSALVPNRDFTEFVGEIVDARHECAHLKIEKGFGYSPNDPEVTKVVGPLLPLLEELARRCVEGEGLDEESHVAK